METIFTWPMIRLIKRISIVCTSACLLYVLVALIYGKSHKGYDHPTAGNLNTVSVLSPLHLDVPFYDAAADPKARDVFMPYVPSGGTMANAPQGQFPDHLRVVGVIIAHPSQIIIEDSLAHQTYFIDEGTPRDGFNITQVTPDQMVVNYQGQDIIVPVGRK